MDALAYRYPFELDELRRLRSRYLGARGSRRIEPVLALVDRRAESPMESRIRVVLVLGGFRLAVQYPVRLDGCAIRLDLAFPEVRLGVAFDGAHHRTAEQAREDLRREAMLTAAGWKVIRGGIMKIFDRRPVPVVPVGLRNLWGSYFSRAESGRAMARPFRRAGGTAFELVAGPPVEAAAVTPAGLRDRVATLTADPVTKRSPHPGPADR